MRVRRPRHSDGIEFASDDRGKIRVSRIDLGVNDCNKHVIPLVDAVSFEQMQFANDVLRGSAVWHVILLDLRLVLDCSVHLVCLAGGYAR